MNNDQEHLRWLSIGFYVNAGLIALFSMFPIIHVVIGIMMITGGFEGDNNPPPPMLGWFFAGVGGAFIMLGMTFAVTNIIAARSLTKRTRYMFIFVIAAINCMFAPIGTVLGVFTVLVLLRDSVKELFNKGVSQFGSNADGLY